MDKKYKAPKEKLIEIKEDKTEYTYIEIDEFGEAVSPFKKFHISDTPGVRE
jgi:hypothetical protein